MSRYDREAAFFDAVHDFGKRHPVLDLGLAYLSVTVAYGLLMIGPGVGWLAIDLIWGLDPDSGGQMLAGAAGGSMACSALTFAVVGLWHLPWRSGHVCTEERS